MESYYTQIEPILREVRELLLPCYGNIACENKSKDAYDVVTELDVSVELFLKDALYKVFPDIAFVGEETGGDRSASIKWLCDPIDGTGHYIRGMPFCTTMLALIENEQVIFSAIYDFIHDEIYHAERGKGAYREKKRLSVSERTLRQGYIAWETHINRNDENVKTHLALTRKTAFFKSICAGFEFIQVASGRLDGRIQFDGYGKDYDYAPGSLLVEEAGGIIKNIGKDYYDYRNLDFLACNPTVYKELTEGPDAIFPMKKN